MQFRRQSAAWGTLWAVAAVPFLAAVVFHALGPLAQKPAKGAERPSLAFDQYLVNIGRVDTIPQVHAWFQFYNQSDHPVVVESLNPSCGCLQPRLEKIDKDNVSGGLQPVSNDVVFGPKERGRILLRVTTAGQKSGQNEYTVNVNYTDDIPRETTLTFKVQLPEKTIGIHPPVLQFYQLSEEPTVKEVVISDTRENPCRVVSVVSTSNVATVELQRPTRETDPSTRATLTVTVRGDIAPGSHDASLLVYTDDPKSPKLTIPVRVFGPTSTTGQSPVRQASHVHSAPHPGHAEDADMVVPPERGNVAQ